MNNDSRSILIDGALTREGMRAALGRALGIPFEGDSAISEEVEYFFEADDAEPGFRWVLDVFADNPEQASIDALRIIGDALPSWKLRHESIEPVEITAPLPTSVVSTASVAN